jgi:hypothetical protein
MPRPPLGAAHAQIIAGLRARRRLRTAALTLIPGERGIPGPSGQLPKLSGNFNHRESLPCHRENFPRHREFLRIVGRAFPVVGNSCGSPGLSADRREFLRIVGRVLPVVGNSRGSSGIFADRREFPRIIGRAFPVVENSCGSSGISADRREFPQIIGRPRESPSASGKSLRLVGRRWGGRRPWTEPRC